MNLSELKAIFIEAGHGVGPTGLQDVGAAANGTTERNEVVEIARETVGKIALQDPLKNVSIFPIGIDQAMKLTDKIAQINKICNERGYNASNALLVSVHINSAGDTSASGIEAWYYGNDATSKKFGETIANQVAHETAIKVRPAQSEFVNRHGQLGIIHDTKPLATLIECGFITNTGDVSILKDQKLDDKYAIGIVKGILEFVGGGAYQEVKKDEIPMLAGFKDVPASEWYAPHVKSLSEKNIMKGNDGIFRPGATMTRAEVAKTVDLAISYILSQVK
jgi:N-acetylmuramoyl-L-alanine amidase